MFFGLAIKKIVFETAENSFAKHFFVDHCFRPSTGIDDRTTQYN